MTSTQAAQLEALYNNMFNGGDLLALDIFQMSTSGDLKTGAKYFNSSYVQNITHKDYYNRSITFNKKCNIEIIQSLSCATTWSQVQLLLNDTVIATEKYTEIKVGYVKISKSVNSGDVLNILYTSANVGLVGGVTVITLS